MSFGSDRPGFDAGASPWSWRWLAAAPPLLALLFALGLWATLDAARVKDIVAESGAIELTTAWLYFVLAALMWLWRRPEDELLEWAALSLVFVAFGARELDLHRYWTHDSMLKLSFYLREAPLPQKLVSAAVVLLLGATAVFVVRRFAGRVWRGLGRRERVATTVAVFLGVMVVAKVFDRSINILAVDFGIVTPLSAKALVSAVEEILELSLPFVAAIGFLQHRHGSAASSAHPA